MQEEMQHARGTFVVLEVDVGFSAKQKKLCPFKLIFHVFSFPVCCSFDFSYYVILDPISRLYGPIAFSIEIKTTVTFMW